ncbi:MAG: hypothetical protein JWO31_2575 [Phycisphaerales bacterium]|nr:hypothetical protein [Phycisphaerales bacterium]
MDLTATFSGMQQAKIGQEIQTRVAVKAMDNQRQQGEAAIALLQSASQVGSAGDGAGRSQGVGGSVDVYG